MPARPSAPPLSFASWTLCLLAATFTIGLCLHLWPDWLHNPDLSHGLLAPVLVGLLIMEGRRRGTGRYHSDPTGLRVLRATLLALGIAHVVIAGLYAAAVDWTHPLVGFALSLALSGLLLGALLWLSSTHVRVVPLNWPTIIAASFWPLCSPLPPGSYSRLTLQLQLWVTRCVLESLHLLGIAATKSGNIIQLAHANVGVEEACSGVRSLLSCVVAALFLSATLVNRPWQRLLLILLAPPLAFAMNIVRSLGLTLLASAGVDIAGSWHDLTGCAVLGLTTLLLTGLALWLETRPAIPVPLAPERETAPPPQPWGVLTAYAFAVLLIGFFAFNTHGPSGTTRPAPDLAAMLPTTFANWDAVRTENLQTFAPVLKTDHLVQRTYTRPSTIPGTPEPLQITVYLAYWKPGQVPVSMVAMHTPEACWPGSGWVAEPVAKDAAPIHLNHRALPPPQHRSFTQGNTRQHVWYWHLYDGHSITQVSPYSGLELLRFAWNYGFRTAGEQVFVRISSNRPWAEISAEPLLAEITRRLEPHGL